MVKLSKPGFRIICPLTDTLIDSDLCVEVQDCLEGNIPVSLELEEFTEKEDCVYICANCKYHI